MSEFKARKAYACCVHCEDANDDHAEHGGIVEKDRHETSCPTCDRASEQFRAGVEAALRRMETVNVARCDTWTIVHREVRALLSTPPAGGDA